MSWICSLMTYCWQRRLATFALLFTVTCTLEVAGWFARPAGVRADAASVASVASADRQGVITVTAKLVEIPSKPPPDDLYDYAYVMRYQVIGGPLDKTSILVAHYRPLVPRSKVNGKMKAFVAGKLRSFVHGDIHKLKLSPALKQIWKGELVDDFEATDHKSVRYWCLEADPG
jgi:hypothetical protein